MAMTGGDKQYTRDIDDGVHIWFASLSLLMLFTERLFGILYANVCGVVVVVVIDILNANGRKWCDNLAIAP